MEAIGEQLERARSGLYLRPLLLQLTKAIISICPPLVGTLLVCCTSLAPTAAIGRQVLARGTITSHSACASAMITSTLPTMAAATGTGSALLSSLAITY